MLAYDFINVFEIQKPTMQNMLNMQQKRAMNANHDIIMQNRSKSFH